MNQPTSQPGYSLGDEFVKALTKAERRAKELAKAKCSVSGCKMRAARASGTDGLCGTHLRAQQEQEDHNERVVAASHITSLINSVNDVPTRLALEELYVLINSK